MKTRSKLLFMFILISAGIILLMLSSCSSSQEMQANKKVTSVLIMPISKSEGVYFRNDQVWHNLVWSFESKGFNVINNDSVWNSLVNDGYDLARLTDAQVLQIAQNYKTDLIISKNAPTGVIGVFDCKEKKFVVYDETMSKTDYDVRSSDHNYFTPRENRFGTLVMKVKGLGY